MTGKKIKIPKGEFTLVFERGNLFSTITDEMLMQFINEGVADLEKSAPKEREAKQPLTYDEVYDDENSDYIRQSPEEI